MDPVGNARGHARPLRKYDAGAPLLLLKVVGARGSRGGGRVHECSDPPWCASPSRNRSARLCGAAGHSALGARLAICLQPACG